MATTMQPRRTGSEKPPRPLPFSVIELARRAEKIDRRQVRRKAYFNVAVMVAALVTVAADVWVVSQGLVVTGPAKRLAAFIGLGALALFVVAVFALVALLLEAFGYEHLRALVAEESALEATEETTVAVDVLDLVVTALLRHRGFLDKELEKEIAREVLSPVLGPEKASEILRLIETSRQKGQALPPPAEDLARLRESLERHPAVWQEVRTRVEARVGVLVDAYEG